MSIEDSLLKLNELKEKGVLTDEEFSKRKAQILANSNDNPESNSSWRKLLAGIVCAFAIYFGLSAIQNTKSTTSSKLSACDNSEVISALRDAYNQSQFAQTLNLSVIDVKKPIEASISSSEKMYCITTLILNNATEIGVEFSMESKDQNKFLLLFKQVEATKVEDASSTLPGISQIGNELPEAVLIKALTPNKEKIGRIGESRAAIQAYIKYEVIDKNPSLRSDYTDYYVVKKPSKFMGHELVILEEEYMSADSIGCCVSRGIGLLLKANDSIEKLNRFAEKNSCSVVENINPNKFEQEVGGQLNLAPGKYASLSCRERDLSQMR